MGNNVNLGPAINTNNLDLSRVQQRYDAIIRQLLSTPWGNGILIEDIGLKNTTSAQTIRVQHGLGRGLTVALIAACTVPFYGPWGITMVDNNNAELTLILPQGIPAGSTGSCSVWAY